MNREKKQLNAWLKAGLIAFLLQAVAAAVAIIGGISRSPIGETLLGIGAAILVGPKFLFHVLATGSLVQGSGISSSFYFAIILDWLIYTVIIYGVIRLRRFLRSRAN